MVLMVVVGEVTCCGVSSSLCIIAVSEFISPDPSECACASIESGPSTIIIRFCLSHDRGNVSDLDVDRLGDCRSRSMRNSQLRYVRSRRKGEGDQAAKLCTRPSGATIRSANRTARLFGRVANKLRRQCVARRTVISHGVSPVTLMPGAKYIAVTYVDLKRETE